MRRVAFAGAAVVGLLASVTPAGAGGLGTMPNASSSIWVRGGVTATIEIDPLLVRLQVGATTVRVGAEVLATETVTNLGRAPLFTASVLVEPDARLVVTPPRQQFVGKVQAFASKRVGWIFCFTAPGRYAVVVEAAAQDGAGRHDAAYSRRLIVTVIGARDECAGL